MRNFVTICLTGAIALVSLVACNKEITDNPNYNKETNEVLTSFVFNVASNNTPLTRQTSAATQATSSDSFRGIKDASLLTFVKGTPAADGGHIAATTTSNKHYGLGDVMSTTQATTDGTKSHRVIELALPIETNVLMFYGRAPQSGTDADNVQGKITFKNASVTDDKSLAKYEFSLNRRVPSADEPKYRQYGDLIRAALDYVCDAQLNNADVVYNATHYPTTVKWTHFVTISSAGIISPATKDPLHGGDLCALGGILGDALATLATIKTGEVRAGSGSSVSRTLGDLMIVVTKVHDAIPTSEHEAVIVALAGNIINRINAVTTGTAPSLTWKTKDEVASAISYSGAVDQITRKASTGSALDEYPDISFGVPKGCAQLLVETAASTDDAGRVTSPGTINWKYSSTTPLLSATSTSIYNVYYPAEICYFGNSPIRTTDDAHVEADYPQGVANWDTDGQWAAGVNNNTVAWSKNTHVVSTTRSVAMQQNINYGTALLKSTVGYAATDLQDNNHAIQLEKNPSLPASEEPNKVISVTANSFRLTGILVGGQPETVGWDFTPVSGTTFVNNIYDKAIASDAIPVSGTSEPNYTLVWDNWNASLQGNKQNDVYVALEFVNETGQDFWGNKNVVRNGGTFYIIGKLDPDAGLSTTDRSAGITWPDATLQNLPPYDASGNTIKERRVFIQDYMTTANFKLNETSLQHAYATVPDLRSTQISLGLSVDLKWQAGLVFDNVILGQ